MKFTCNGNTYSVYEKEGFLAIRKNDGLEFLYKVQDSKTHAYKVQKTQINARGGVSGLLSHFTYCLENDFAVSAWVINPVESILKTVKHVRVTLILR